MYAMAERQLRRGLIIGNLSSAVGYIAPIETFNYTALACLPSDGCDLNAVYSMPPAGKVLGPMKLPNRTYSGDFTPGQHDNDGYERYSTAEDTNGMRLGPSQMPLQSQP
jgi:hypothetical protein